MMNYRNCTKNKLAIIAHGKPITLNPNEEVDLDGADLSYNQHIMATPGGTFQLLPAIFDNSTNHEQPNRHESGYQEYKSVLPATNRR